MSIETQQLTAAQDRILLLETSIRKHRKLKIQIGDDPCEVDEALWAVLVGVADED